jgi:hypothetical protein
MDISRRRPGADSRRDPHLTAHVQDSLEMGQTEVQMAAVRRVAVVPSTGGLCPALL